MTAPRHAEHECVDCGIKITGVPVVPPPDAGVTEAQLQKLKPTVYLCIECAQDRGLTFDEVTVGKAAAQAG